MIFGRLGGRSTHNNHPDTNKENKMASLSIPAENLSVGDTLLLPFGKTATIIKIAPVGPRTRFVKFTTEYGATRIEVGTSVSVMAKVLS